MNNFSYLRSHCALWARARGWFFDVHSLALAKERTKKTSKGLCPLTPRGFAALRSPCRRGKAQRFWQAQMPRLVRHRLQDGLGRRSMPDFGQTRRPHIEIGGVRLKPFCTMAERDINEPLVGGKSLDFPTRNSALRRSFSQPRKNVDKHFCLGAEISMASAQHYGNPKGRALWCAFLLRSLPQGKE